MTTLHDDFKLFRRLVGNHLNGLIRDCGVDDVKRTKVYKQFHSETYFERTFPDPDARRAYLDELASFLDEEKRTLQRLERTLLPLFLDPDRIKKRSR
jgi:hypothetical protein